MGVQTPDELPTKKWALMYEILKDIRIAEAKANNGK